MHYIDWPDWPDWPDWQKDRKTKWGNNRKRKRGNDKKDRMIKRQIDKKRNQVFWYVKLTLVSYTIFVQTRSCAALRAADLGLSGQDAFQARTFGRFPTSLFSPQAHGSKWILILIQLLQIKDRKMWHINKQTQFQKLLIFRDSNDPNWPPLILQWMNIL